MEGRWIGRDKLHERVNSHLYTYNKNSTVDKSDILGRMTMIIHGTRVLFDRITYILGRTEDEWWNLDFPGDSFSKALNKEVKDVWRITSDKKSNRIYKPFTWLGGNWHLNRWGAAESLANYIIKIRTCYPNEKIKIVTHSHGGNVVMRALDILSQKRNKDAYTVDYVILLGTPHISIRYNGIRRSLYFTDAGRRMIRKNIYSISSENDTVQAFWADVSEGISKKHLPSDYKSDSYNFVQVEKFYPQKDVGLIGYNPGNDEDWFTKSGKEGHSDMHSVEMAKIVAKLLNGTHPSSIDELKKPPM